VLRRNMSVVRLCSPTFLQMSEDQPECIILP
jgi:hypothetical protein